MVMVRPVGELVHSAASGHPVQAVQNFATAAWRWCWVWLKLMVTSAGQVTVPAWRSMGVDSYSLSHSRNTAACAAWSVEERA
jgi:hypothetical protein